MTRYLLDTNIISHAIKPSPPGALMQWMADQADEDLFIASLSLAEIRRGILQMPEGRKKREREEWCSGPGGPQARCRHRVLRFDDPAARVWAQWMAEGTAKGQPRSALDMIIAAIGTVRACLVVTDNEKDFRNAVDIFNPLRPNSG